MQTTTRKTIVDIDTRRSVFMAASVRKAQDATKVPHEQFIRNMLKDRLGWPHREPAPDAIKQVAREMAAQFVARDVARKDAQLAALAAHQAKVAALAAEA